MVNWKELRQQLLPTAQGEVLPIRIKLPVLPTVVTEFSRRAEDPDVSAQKLGKLIETDATLTCELLKYVNSSNFSARHKIISAQQAISRLGIRNSKSFLLSTAVEQTMKSTKSKLVNVQGFWHSNLERALFAAEIARKLKTDADVAYSSSLLQDFLLPLLGNELYDTYLKFLQLPDSQRIPLQEFETRQLGWDHALAAAQVLHTWGFPDEILCCVRLHHAGLQLLEHPEYGHSPIAAVAIASLLPESLRQTPEGENQLLQLNAIWPDLKLEELATQVSERLLELTPLARQHTPFSRRLQQRLSQQAAVGCS